MRVLMLGGSGMLGHKLWSVLAPRFETHATVRKTTPALRLLNSYRPDRVHENVMAEEFETVERAFRKIRPDVVVNCIGIVKQSGTAKDPIASLTINSLFPHKLARLCGSSTRLIHISTDCVFSGTKGCYSEADIPDATDLYGRTKLLGEVTTGPALTIRTSIIGRELLGCSGLVEWFLSQRGRSVKGFQRAIFSGFTTTALSEILATVIAQDQQLHGLWHVASDAISKFDLLKRIASASDLEIEVQPDSEFYCDRSLDGRAFLAETGIMPPDWDKMIYNLVREFEEYEKYRKAA